MTVVIAGCGDLGTEVGLRLAGTGRRVVGLRRRTHLLPPAIEGVAVDLAAGPVDLPADTEAVVVATAASERSVEGYRRAYVEGLARLLDALDQLTAPPRRIVLVSSTGVYATDDGSWVDEDAPADATSGTSGVLVAAEELLRRRVPGAVVLRLGGIYGPGRDHLVRQVRGGHGVPRPDAWINLIHRDDAAAAVVHLLGRPVSGVVHGVDGAPARRSEVVAFLAGELGVPVPASSGADGPRGAGKRLRNDRLVGSGFTFTYPTFREGYRAVLAGDGTRHP